MLLNSFFSQVLPLTEAIEMAIDTQAEDELWPRAGGWKASTKR